MIYADTGRPAWNLRRGLLRMGGTWLLFLLLPLNPLAAACWALLKSLLEAVPLLPRTGRRHEDAMAARLLGGPLFRLQLLRVVCPLAALPCALAGLFWPSLLLLLAGETLERHLFFSAVHAPKMPGMPAT